MTYKNWWYTEGSAIRPLPNEDIEEFAKRITEIAWSNGQYKAVSYTHLTLPTNREV